MNCSSDVNLKLNSIRDICKTRNVKGLLLEKQNNISWLLKGRTHVGMASINAVVDVLITGEDVFLISNNIEAKRMTQEEFQADVESSEFYWYETGKREQLINELTGGSYVKDSECETEIKELRLIMTPNEKEIYRELAKDAADAIQTACLSVEPGMTEFKAAGILAKECYERGLEPALVLVAADERVNLYRHPLPTSKEIENYVMLVVGARRYGLTASITRFVSFSKPDDELLRKRDAVIEIDAMLIEETRPGAMTANIFNMLIKEYGRLGYPDEWKLHHQGGPTGYNGREYKISPQVDIMVKEDQAYAWNPSITGYKSEDTFLVEKKGNTILTATPKLPVKTVKYKDKTIERPDMLIRKKYI